jgi:GDP-4-dehydro-6-deoxy-D-mannose reductase
VRILITGIGGFVGRHLTAYVLAQTPDAELHGAVIAPEHAIPQAECHVVDLKDEAAVHTLIQRVRPDHIYHLAAQASVGRSFEAPWETLENNILAQLNLITGCLKLETPPRLLIISSGEIYGAETVSDTPPTEDAPLCPSNPYSVSKVAQDMLGLQYYLSHKLPIMRARPFNHLGPGQRLGFVAPDFALQVARIEAGVQAPIMRVGNLSAERDFTDVRDIVRAYFLIMERGNPGEAYNIASGRYITVRYLLDVMLGYSSAQIRVETDTARLRPSGTSRSWGDASRLRRVTGWEPQIPIEQTIFDVLNEFRQQVGVSV